MGRICTQPKDDDRVTAGSTQTIPRMDHSDCFRKGNRVYLVEACRRISTVVEIGSRPSTVVGSTSNRELFSRSALERGITLDMEVVITVMVAVAEAEVGAVDAGKVLEPSQNISEAFLGSEFGEERQNDAWAIV